MKLSDFICKDWTEYFAQKLSLKVYEKEQEKNRKKLLYEKNKILRNNRIIVRVNDDIIYDSKKSGDISDDLYFALLSYGLMDSIKNKSNSHTPISYNITPKISSLPAFYSDINITA